MIKRLVTLHIRTKQVEEFITFFTEHQHAIANSPGCISLQLYQDHQNLDVFYTWSEWKSLASLEAYRKSELFKMTWSKVKPMFAKPAQAKTLLLQRNVK